MLLYETLSQPLTFLFIFLVGVGGGMILDLRNYLVFLCNKNKIVNMVLDIIAGLVISTLFYLSVLIFNYGEMRFYLLLGFIIGLIIERIFLGMPLAKLCSWCYTKFKKFIKIFTKEKKVEKKESLVNN